MIIGPNNQPFNPGASPRVPLHAPETLFARQHRPLTQADAYVPSQFLRPLPQLPAQAVSQNLVSRLLGGAAAAVTAPFSWAFAPISATALKIVQEAKSIIGSRFRMDFLADGRLACAWVASTVLKNADQVSKQVSGCDSLKGVLKREGFQDLNVNQKAFDPRLYKPGDVVFFAKNASGHGHVGIISKIEPRPNGTLAVSMVHNSTSHREVKEIILNDYWRFPMSIYRKAA